MKRFALAAALGCAVVAVLAGCAPDSGGTEALADRVVGASDEFATILEQAAEVETRDLDDGLLTPLGRDYRQLDSTGSMVAVPQGLLSSSIDGRRAAVTLVLATEEHTEHGLTYEHSNAFTCLELAGTWLGIALALPAIGLISREAGDHAARTPPAVLVSASMCALAVLTACGGDSGGNAGAEVDYGNPVQGGTAVISRISPMVTQSSRALWIEADVSNPEEVDRLFKTAIATFGTPWFEPVEEVVRLSRVARESLLREARLLRALEHTPARTPRVLAACEDESVLGGVPFYVMEEVRGTVVTDEIPAALDDPDRRLTRQAVRPPAVNSKAILLAQSCSKTTDPVSRSTTLVAIR